MSELAELRQIAEKKNCIIQVKGGYYLLYRKTGKGVTFIGQRNNLKDLGRLVKRV